MIIRSPMILQKQGICLKLYGVHVCQTLVCCAGYPIGRQIRQLGKLLLSDYVQSQLPAFNFQPLSSLHLPPQTVRTAME